MNPSTKPSTDRREYPRCHLRVKALLLLSEGHQVVARTLDLSEAGVGLVADVNLPVGAKLGIWMNLPDRSGNTRPFKAMAVVNNARLAPSDGGFRIGLHFRDLNEDSIQILRAALISRC